ncbi:MAG TPA: hypothetical protein VGJ32_12410 [Solirubrobacteraceae bacterium]
MHDESREAVDFAIRATGEHDGDPVAAMVAHGLAADECQALEPFAELVVSYERRWGRRPSPDELYGLIALAQARVGRACTGRFERSGRLVAGPVVSARSRTW